MNLEIGMYVRTINGNIWIITSQQAISGHKKDIINASYNIIDLIEVGDYVNGNKVLEKEDYLLWLFDNDKHDTLYFNDEDIKTIVTKEQFSQMEYKVKE